MPAVARESQASERGWAGGQVHNGGTRCRDGLSDIRTGNDPAFASCISAAGQDYAEREKLRAQSNEFRKEVIKVTDGVYVAVGYSASNVILIQGRTGSIIVDTATDPVAARAIRTAFGDLLRTPVHAIIYTHSHPDHTGGARVFAGTDRPQIAQPGWSR